MPQPDHISGCCSRRATTLAARSGGTMPHHSRCPGLLATLQMGALLAIEAVGIEPLRLVPEHGVEPGEQRVRLCCQGRRLLWLVHRQEHLGHAAPGRVDVALQLTQRFRANDLAAVRIDHRVAAVLPADVLIALAGPRAIFLEPVAVAVAVPVDPVQAALRHRQMPAQKPRHRPSPSRPRAAPSDTRVWRPRCRNRACAGSASGMPAHPGAARA